MSNKFGVDKADEVWRFCQSQKYTDNQLAEVFKYFGQSTSKNTEDILFLFSSGKGRIAGLLDDAFRAGKEANLGKVLLNDLEKGSAEFISYLKGKGDEGVKAWDVLRRNGRDILRTDINALGSLSNLLSNPKLASKLPGKSTAQIEDLLGKMKGWGDGTSGVSYKQVADKVNELVDELPATTTNFDKYLGSAGFGNGNVYTNRHSWVQLDRMLEPANKSYINAADEIVFENSVSSSFGNSVTDIAIFKNGRRIEIETKAGLQFFEGVSGSNFPTQSANSLLNVTDVADYKVFLNPEKIATLTNADKLSVINAWKSNSGDFLGNAQIRLLFTDYWDDVPSIGSNAQFENLLSTKSDWFDDIFKNNIE